MFEGEPINRVVWESKSLRIPWVEINRRYAGLLPDNSTGKRKAIAPDQAGNLWIQMAVIASLKEAKRILRKALSADQRADREDLRNRYSTPGVITLSAAKLASIIYYGDLPQTVDRYIAQGRTHLGLGPAVSTYTSDGWPYPYCVPCHLGIWRPVSPAYRNIYQEYIPSHTEVDDLCLPIG